MSSNTKTFGECDVCGAKFEDWGSRLPSELITATVKLNRAGCNAWETEFHVCNKCLRLGASMRDEPVIRKKLWQWWHKRMCPMGKPT